MGMTLSVYRIDKLYAPFDEKYLGGIRRKFYGYTDISSMPSCLYLASLLEEHPIALNYYFMYKTNPRLTLSKDETLYFVKKYMLDFWLWNMTIHPEEDMHETFEEANRLLKNVRDADTDEFELFWS